MAVTLLTPPRILFGGGTVAQVPEVLKSLGVQRPLIVTDDALSRLPLFNRLAEPLRAAGIRFNVFRAPVGEPTTTMIHAGARLLDAGDADGLIAFGGGSPMDTAKAMAVLHAGGGVLRDWKVPTAADMAVLPLLCIPTTAGTGSEVTKFCVVTDVDREPEEKMLIMGQACLPAAAIVDFELTMQLPKRATADTGLDALTHALEAYISVKANAYSDAMALSALRLIGPALRKAYARPDDRDAREAMMVGATHAGMAFSNASVALVHGMSRPVGAFFHVPHGLSNAMLLPAITAFSIEAAPDRYAAAAKALGMAALADDTATACDKLVAGLKALNTDLEVPSPAGYGIDRARWDAVAPTMAEQALASGSPNNNPRVPDAAQMVALYQQVFAGP